MQRHRVGLVIALACGLFAAACGDDAEVADAGPPPDAAITQGTMSFTWDVNDTDMNALMCGDVGAITVRVSMTPSAGGFAVIDALSCNSGMGTTRPLDAGTYNVTMELRGTAGLLSQTATMNNVDVVAGGDTPLGNIVFEVLAQGNFEFDVDTSATGLNCDSDMNDGAGITDVLFELRDSSNQCVNVAMDIAAGAAEPAGTYNTDCATMYGACIENDQTITVTGVPSGAYQLTIRAWKGGLECWMRAPQFNVPGNDLSFLLGRQELMLDPVPGCDPNAMYDAGVPVVDAGPTFDAAP
jgi:hypothetical protein